MGNHTERLKGVPSPATPVAANEIVVKPYTTVKEGQSSAILITLSPEHLEVFYYHEIARPRLINHQLSFRDMITQSEIYISGRQLRPLLLDIARKRVTEIRIEPSENGISIDRIDRVYTNAEPNNASPTESSELPSGTLQ